MNSRLALGTVQFGLDYGISNSHGIVNLKEINQILKIAKNAGINLLDTAQAYGTSEKQIGRAQSSQFKIVTKIRPGTPLTEINQSVNESLKKLNRKKLFGLLFHNFRDFQNDPEGLNKIQLLKDANIVEKIGFSIYLTHELEDLFLKDVKFDIIQIPYNIFDRRFYPYLSELRSRGIEIHARSVFLQGLVYIEPDKLSSHFSKFIPYFKDFKNKINNMELSVEEVCLKFILAHNEINNLILGVTNCNELIKNIDAANSRKISNKDVFDSFSEYQINDEEIVLPYNWK